MVPVWAARVAAWACHEAGYPNARDALLALLDEAEEEDA